MQQGDQTVLSLRPGGGRGGSRLLGSSTFSFGSISSSDLPLLRPHGGAASFSKVSLGNIGSALFIFRCIHKHESSSFLCDIDVEF